MNEGHERPELSRSRDAVTWSATTTETPHEGFCRLVGENRCPPEGQPVKDGKLTTKKSFSCEFFKPPAAHWIFLARAIKEKKKKLSFQEVQFLYWIILCDLASPIDIKSILFIYLYFYFFLSKIRNCFSWLEESFTSESNLRIIKNHGWPCLQHLLEEIVLWLQAEFLAARCYEWTA